MAINRNRIVGNIVARVRCNFYERVSGVATSRTMRRSDIEDRSRASDILNSNTNLLDVLPFE